MIERCGVQPVGTTRHDGLAALVRVLVARIQAGILAPGGRMNLVDHVCRSIRYAGNNIQ